MEDGIYYELQNENTRLREEIKGLREENERLKNESLETSLLKYNDVVYYPKPCWGWDGKKQYYAEVAIFVGELAGSHNAVLHLLSSLSRDIFSCTPQYKFDIPVSLLSRSIEEFDKRAKAGEFDSWAESLT